MEQNYRYMGRNMRELGQNIKYINEGLYKQVRATNVKHRIPNQNGMGDLSKGARIYPLEIGGRDNMNDNEVETSVGARDHPHDPCHLVFGLHRRYGQYQLSEFGDPDVAYQDVGNFCEWADNMEGV